MTTREMLDFYVDLVRKKGQKWYKITHKSKHFQKHKESFMRLKEVLDHKEIPIKDYIQVQFMGKGYRPYPNQLMGEAAFKRWEEYKRTENSKAEYETQERYLKRYIEQDYTLEEALEMPQFTFWFRCMKVKKPKASWKFYSKKELDKSPGLRDLIKRGYFGNTI
jgi:hypothetical protein